MHVRIPIRGLAVVCAFLTMQAVPVRSASAASFKLAYWNIKSGKGQIALPGHSATFFDTSNCTDATKPLNAWGVNLVQRELAKLNHDPQIVALGLGEAWTSVCGSPARVRATLGWAAHSGERNGVAVVARYGFAGPARWQQLDTSLTSNPGDTMWVVRTPVCLDASCLSAMTVFTAHWGGDSKPELDVQSRETVAFMSSTPPGEPHVLIGDLNVWEGTTTVCNQTPQNTALGDVVKAGFTDGWTYTNGVAEGYTGMANRAGCGLPLGYSWKRIDYSWSKNTMPLSMTRFGVVTPGDGAPSDHYGIIVEYPMPDGPLPPSAPPTASIAAPFANTTIAGTKSIDVSAEDDRAVSRVDILLDGSALWSDTTMPYQGAWDTTQAVNGVHVLQARAYDADGNVGDSTPVAVSVNNVAPPEPPGDIVLYTAHAPTVVGAWQAVPDATAAGGERLWNPDASAAKPSAALAAPANYFELSFRAEAGRPYRLWVRSTAQKDFWGNDSVYVQFGGSVTSTGTPTYRIGSTSGTVVILEDCSGCSITGWGWQDNAYGVGALGPLVYFAQSGVQTIRVQQREDGISIDQIVLSPQYLTSAPGALKKDATIVGGAQDPVFH